VKEKLFSGGENEVTSAIDALQNLIGEVHPMFLGPTTTGVVNGSGQTETGENRRPTTS
jgi:hypothetical protein